MGMLNLRMFPFGYVENKTILKEVSLKAQPGETIALVGPTGSGRNNNHKLINSIL